MLTRMFSAKTEQVIQGFGGTQPLELKLGIELLSEQCQACYKAFHAFQNWCKSRR